jgi:copper chaperone NosL
VIGDGWAGLPVHSSPVTNHQSLKIFKMKSTPKVLFFIAAAMLLMLFVFPMWQITLIAPQYPKGVTMYIWINKITGSEEGTLQNINILNHYVGMKNIEPDDFKEFKYFPIVVLVMSAFGMLLAFTGRWKWWMGWLLLGLIGCVLGLYDFYLWEYDYGHNLSPTAPIKIPGMAYQPPLIGNKTLLNFLAKSWPYIGGWFVGSTFILGSIAVWLQRKKTSVL